MTVSYTAEVATCRGFGCFLKLLFRWRGSIYKLVWMDSIVFLFLYYSLSCVYRLALDASQKEMFEDLARYCNSYGSLIPLSFVLGFYVAIAMKRWWDQYMTIPWPDPIAVYVSSLVHGQDERGRVMRRTILRYACLCLTIVLGSISPRVKKRFPSMNHFVDAGLLQENEKFVMQNLDARFPKHSKHWMPIVWAASIVRRARNEGRIRDDFAVKTIIDELNKFRGRCGLLVQYDVISIPLVYTQVVTLAVYSYFLCSIMGKQWTERPVKEGYYNMVDNYFPLFTTLEFFFYVGWLKVAESLINPFGNDDDDFEVNWLIDRNLQVSYLIVDEMHHEHPELIKDQFWDEVFPNALPYANDSNTKREEPPESSTAKLGISKSSLSTIKLDCAVSQSLSCMKSRIASSQRGASRDSSQPASNQTSVSRLNSAVKVLLRRSDPDRASVQGSALTRDSLPSLKESKRVPSSSVAVIQPSPKEVDPQASSGKIRIVTDLDDQDDEENDSRTLVNRQPSADPPDVREIFRQSPSVIMRYNTTSGESLAAPYESAHGGSKDDFDRLKEQREKERLQRQRDNLIRTVSNAANLPISSITQMLSSAEHQAALPHTESQRSVDDTHEREESKDEMPPKT